MLFKQKTVLIVAVLILLVAAGAATFYFLRNSEKNFHKGTLVNGEEYRKTAEVKGKVPYEEFALIYQD